MRRSRVARYTPSRVYLGSTMRVRMRTVLARSIAADVPSAWVLRAMISASGSAGALPAHAPSAAMALATASQVPKVVRSRARSGVTRRPSQPAPLPGAARSVDATGAAEDHAQLLRVPGRLANLRLTPVLRRHLRHLEYRLARLRQLVFEQRSERVHGSDRLLLFLGLRH